MKIYIAAPYPMLQNCRLVAGELTKLGFEVTSRWLDPLAEDESTLSMKDRPVEDNDKFARMDLDDVASAEVVLLINPEEWSNAGTGGRHFEVGVAYAIRRDIIIWGVRSQIFHYLADITTLERFEDVIKELNSRRGAQAQV